MAPWDLVCSESKAPFTSFVPADVSIRLGLHGEQRVQKVDALQREGHDRKPAVNSLCKSSLPTLAQNQTMRAEAPRFAT